MKEKQYDEEMLRLMLEWLNRSVGASGVFEEVDASVEMELTNEDYEFLRDYRIAIP